MAKSKLTKQAIRFLVDTYDDETTNHTFHQVRKMIEDKFKITVTYEAIRKSYHANKNLLRAEEVGKTKEKPEAGVTSVEKDKPKSLMSELRAIREANNRKEYRSISEDIDDEEVLALFSSPKPDQDE
ncbi:hypothetical protein [Psychrobacter sp. Ps7]|jgi:hypothetical protein|uniref:hypothetical protein n=1 Tax=Psychrobacter sp. Ps7 TaxID=2790961 RepID=UPI001EE06D20|nr:hypothetical protein [Psychrobacter sp. Ps7]MCG3873836.1 hypothetical protein [Psychrobacter sp. Ps7]